VCRAARWRPELFVDVGKLGALVEVPDRMPSATGRRASSLKELAIRVT